MREPKVAWVRALRALTGYPEDNIRYNETICRWEFILTSADGIPRSQIWGLYRNPMTGDPIEPDKVTGMHPFRELDDVTIREALGNLQRTFVGNPYDGAGTPRKEIMNRIRSNRDEGQRRWTQGGLDFADMVNDRAKRLRGATQVSVITEIGG